MKSLKLFQLLLQSHIHWLGCYGLIQRKLSMHQILLLLLTFHLNRVIFMNPAKYL